MAGKVRVHTCSFPHSIGCKDLFLRFFPGLILLGWTHLTLFRKSKVVGCFLLGAVGFLQTTGMFFLFTGVLYSLTHDVVFVIKFFGPVLLAVLCCMMFFYARKGLGWGNSKSLLVSVLVATYFVSLRNSWDLYRQTLGLIFLVAALISLKSFRSPHKYYVASVFMVLTVLSHELACGYFDFSLF